MNYKNKTCLISLCMASLVISGCTSVPKRTRVAVPEQFIHTASIPGIPRARRMGDEPPKYLNEIINMTPEEAQKAYPGIIGKKHAYLALSGGGSNGAFGAGLLNGWTATGTRPEFTMVTGISAGAILAPWAFLGPDYDYVARELFTKYDTEATLVIRNVITGLRRDAFADTAPLRAIIHGYLGDAEVEKIALEHKKGRRLLIGTVNVDMMRPITWNLGEIACSDYPDKRDLMVDIILASASIPVGLPPIFIDVEADGKTYQEMHVDGGLGRQVFFYPQGVHWDDIEKIVQPDGTPEVYLIRNARLAPRWKEVKPTIIDLGARSLSSLLRTQGIGDILKIYLSAGRDGVDFHLAHIPKDFNKPSEEPFDLEYMHDLYNLAYESITQGDPWIKNLDYFTY